MTLSVTLTGWPRGLVNSRLLMMFPINLKTIHLIILLLSSKTSWYQEFAGSILGLLLLWDSTHYRFLETACKTSSRRTSTGVLAVLGPLNYTILENDSEMVAFHWNSFDYQANFCLCCHMDSSKYQEVEISHLVTDYEHNLSLVI